MADSYKTLNDHLNELAQREQATIETKVILPSSFYGEFIHFLYRFLGSPRFYSETYEDAMAIVRRYGKPDLFITMTANADWPEIKEAIRISHEDGSIQQKPEFRPDIVSRVFKLKVDQLIDDIVKKQIFGKVAAYVYSIEFQKVHHALLLSAFREAIRTCTC